ncbi:MAG TPA: translation elongation factor Ts [Acidimicrobiales bacterium]|jgi:elongation factor Ts|nr:translation elongation factor Ts [Acidimicrobiales bacterium]
MANFTAKDVQALRQSTGAGMMDAKKALTENDGDSEAAAKWLREKGLSKAAGRADRENSQGAVAIARVGDAAAVVELKSETDFVAKSDQFTELVQTLADRVAADGAGAADSVKDAVDDLKVTLKENIEVGAVIRVEAAPGNLLDTYLHRQDGRGVNGVIVELSGGTPELAHDLAVHIAFTKPPYLTRDEVPAEEVDAERETLTNLTRAEGKPEAALDKIVQGRLGGWYAERVLLEQKFVRDEKQTVKALLGNAELVRFAQVYIGA